MKNLGLIAMVLLLITGCIENNSSNASDEEQKEVVSTSNELKSLPRVERPADVNLREGEEFLAENGKKEGVVVLESGVQLLELIPGMGEVPAMQNNVTVHYHGTLIDGTVFDSSVERAEPFTHNMSDPLIKGWVEGLLHMKTGAKYRVFMPASSGYGGGGQGAIGPNSALIFEIELLSINS